MNHTRQMIYTAISLERTFQDHKHPNFRPAIRLAVLMEEAGEIGTAIQNNDIENLEFELTQLAAVCVRWLEKIKEEKR